MTSDCDNTRPIHILQVEDNRADVQLIRIALKKARMPSILHAVEDGEQALDYLFHRHPFNAVPRPDLILLDINMPRLSGIEVLTIVKQSPETRSIPVIMFTSSIAESDIVNSYNNYANSYINKPAGLNELLEVVRKIEDFWFGAAKLPPSS